MTLYQAVPQNPLQPQTFSNARQAEQWLQKNGGGIIKKAEPIPLAFPIDQVIYHKQWVMWRHIPQ